MGRMCRMDQDADPPPRSFQSNARHVRCAGGMSVLTVSDRSITPELRPQRTMALLDTFAIASAIVVAWTNAFTRTTLLGPEVSYHQFPALSPSLPHLPPFPRIGNKQRHGSVIADEDVFRMQ